MSIGSTPKSALRPQLILREMEPPTCPQWAVLKNFRGGYRTLATFGSREQALLEFPQAIEYFGSMSPDRPDDTD